jgi:hypothetical protein
MMYAFEMGSGAVIYVPKRLVQAFKSSSGGYRDTQTGISPLLVLQITESGVIRRRKGSKA